MARAFPRDIQEFLDEYPHQRVTSWRENLQFYSGQRKLQLKSFFRRGGKPESIDEFHVNWFKEYDELESNHGFIQWLFPIREQGMNPDSKPLQAAEREAMASNPEIVARVIKSYKLMLDFYGMELLDEDTGLLQRTEEYEPQYSNLMESPHNNLRITRILKHLSEMGLEHLNAGFLLHVLNEQCQGELDTRYLKSSMDMFWANCIRNEGERLAIGRLIRKVREGRLDFTRELYERALQNRKEQKPLPFDEENLYAN